MSSFVSDNTIVDRFEYALVVSKTPYNEFVIFLCSSQTEVTAKLDAEIGAWYLHDGANHFKRIKPPVPTDVIRTKKGDQLVQVSIHFRNPLITFSFSGYRARDLYEVLPYAEAAL